MVVLGLNVGKDSLPALNPHSYLYQCGRLLRPPKEGEGSDVSVLWILALGD